MKIISATLCSLALFVPAAGGSERVLPFHGHVVSPADANGDARVDAEEWTAFLERLDPDGDGVISPQVVAEVYGRTRRSGEDARPARGSVREQLLLQRSLAPSRDGVYRVSALRGIFARLDGDGDGALARAEIPDFTERPTLRRRQDNGSAGVLLMNLADSDRDGAVSIAEWRALCSGLDGNDDGAVEESEVDTYLVDRGLVGAEPWRRERVFERVDTDTNGVLTEEELAGYFAAADLDTNTEISAPERARLASLSRRPEGAGETAAAVTPEPAASRPQRR